VTDFPTFWGVNNARGELAQFRESDSDADREQVDLSYLLTVEVERYFRQKRFKVIGRALIIAAASAKAISDDTSSQVITNIIALAGDALMTDGEAVDD
jgi:hypothetical protein